MSVSIVSAKATLSLPLSLTKLTDNEIFVNIQDTNGYVNILKLDSNLNIVWNL